MEKASAVDVQPKRLAEQPAIGRRGLFAAAWAAVAAFVLRKSGTTVEATSGGGADGALIMGSNGLNLPNSAAATTLIESAANFPHTEMFVMDATSSGSSGSPNCVALRGVGRGTAAGLVGMHQVSFPALYPTELNAGVYGSAILAEARGVAGQHLGSGSGVVGQSGIGGIGVQGLIPSSNSTVSGISVYGRNLSNFAGASPGAGGFGVYGLSARGHGVVGATATSGGAAVVGASNNVTGAFAGAFFGPVVVFGDFAVVGAKSAAVPHPDGSHRRLYCVESPESWFEDFGKSRLACGEAVVTIDPDFAAVTEMDDYHVFVTPYEDHDLRVSAQTPAQFTVRAKDSAASGRFSWRVVARRKDIRGERMAPIAIPPQPTLPDVPSPETQP